MIGVVATISNDGATFGDIWLKALSSLGNVGPVTSSQPQVHRATTTIANQMQF